MMRRLLLISSLLVGGWARANVVGSDIQNFNPITSGVDFVTVHSSETLEPGIFNFGLFINYAVNTMPNFEDVTSQRRTDFEDTLFGGDFNFGVGLAKNWDVGFSMPQVLSQTSDDTTNVYRGEISQTGLTEYRLNTKYRLFGDADGGMALALTINLPEVENNPFTGSDPGPTWNIEGIYDFKSGLWNYGFNAGYRSRDPGTAIPNVPIQPYKDSFIASVAASRYIESWDMKFITEIYSSFNTEKTAATTDRDLSSMEWLAGLKKDIRHNLALHFGAATEIYHGSSSPDWRVYTGINWNMGPLWGQSENREDSRVLSPEVTYADIEPEAAPVTSSEKFFVGDVLFAYDSDEIAPAFEEVLLDLASYLKTTGFKSLLVEGFTDSVGAEAYNQDLSQRRAERVVSFLAEKGGLDQQKMEGVGRGEANPVADNANFQGRAQNRRVEFNVQR